MSESLWYHTFQGQRHGPMPLMQLKQMVSSGQLPANEVVWREGMTEWAPVRVVPELWDGPTPPLPPIGYYAPPPAAPVPMSQDAGLRMILPVGRSGYAIAAGYLGLFSVLMFPAPIAILFAILAIRDIRGDKTKHGMGRAIFGLIMGILGSIGLSMMIGLRLGR